MGKDDVLALNLSAAECYFLNFPHPFTQRHQPPVDLAHDFVGQLRHVHAGWDKTACTGF
jgi:hypothetical protein